MQEYKRLSALTRRGIERERMRKKLKNESHFADKAVKDDVEPFHPQVEWSMDIIAKINDLSELDPDTLSLISCGSLEAEQVYEMIANKLLEIAVIVEAHKKKKKKRGLIRSKNLNFSKPKP